MSRGENEASSCAAFFIWEWFEIETHGCTAASGDVSLRYWVNAVFANARLFHGKC